MCYNSPVSHSFLSREKGVVLGGKILVTGYPLFNPYVWVPSHVCWYALHVHALCVCVCFDCHAVYVCECTSLEVIKVE